MKARKRTRRKWVFVHGWLEKSRRDGSGGSHTELELSLRWRRVMHGGKPTQFIMWELWRIQ